MLYFCINQMNNSEIGRRRFMSKINPDYLCPGCMAVLDEPDLPCPLCGFDKVTYAPSPRSLRPFTRLNGKYLVGKVIGEGGFGMVHFSVKILLIQPFLIQTVFNSFGIVGFRKFSCHVFSPFASPRNAGFYEKSPLHSLQECKGRIIRGTTFVHRNRTFSQLPFLPHYTVSWIDGMTTQLLIGKSLHHPARKLPSGILLGEALSL